MKYKIEDIFVFCESIEKMSYRDIEGVVSDVTTQYHILRHFKDLPESYISTLLNKQYEYYASDKNKFVHSIVDKNSIEEGLKTKGSKFISKIQGLETPKEVISLIQNKLSEKINNESIFWMKKPLYKTTMFSFEYSKDIGYDNIVSVESLNNNEKSKITKTPRGTINSEDKIFIQSLTGIQIKKTRKICVELTNIPNRNHFSVTAYPGNLSPDFPNPLQTEEERLYCTEY